LVDPYIDSPGVREFMRREAIKSWKEEGRSKDEILKFEGSLTRESMVESCTESIRDLFKEQRNEKAPIHIEYMVRQGNSELDAVEDKIISQGKTFGMVKDKGNVKYVYSDPQTQD